MPPNVTNVVPEILMVTAQKRAGNTDEFESALSNAIDGQTSPAPNTDASENVTETDAVEQLIANPETAVPADVLAILMSLLAQPPVVVPVPQPQANEHEENKQPTPKPASDELLFSAGLLVTNEQPAPTNVGEAAKKTEAKSGQEIPFQIKQPPAEGQPAPVETAALDPLETTDPTPAPTDKNHPKAEIAPVAISMPEAAAPRGQTETPSKGDTPKPGSDVPAINISAPVASKPPDILLVEAATLSPLKQATQRVPEPVRTVAMSIGKLTAELGQEVRLQLHPESLGRLDVKLNYEGTQVHVHLSAEVPQTGDLLQQYQSDLRVILAEAGVAVGQLTVSVGNGRPHAERERGFTPDEQQPAPSTQSKIAPTAARKPDVKTSLIDYRV